MVMATGKSILFTRLQGLEVVGLFLGREGSIQKFKSVLQTR